MTEKIVFIYADYPHAGGVSTVIQKLAENFVRMGDNVEVISSKTLVNSDNEYINGVYVRRFKLKYPNFLSMEMITYMRTIRDSVIHLHGFHNILNFFVIFFIHNSNTIILNMHYHGKSGSQYKSYLILIYNKLFNYLLQKIDAVICDSLFEKDLIIKNFNYSQDKIFVIPPGYDLDRILKHDWNPTKDGFKKILYVGRIVRHKNVHELVKSLKLINNAKLTIIGTGNYEAQIMELIRVNNLSKSIQWKKNLKYDELLDEYCNADIFVLPSIYEAFGIVVGEAALIGCPIIVADSYALKEFVNVGLAKAVTMPINCEKLAELINGFHAESPRNKAVNYFKDWREISEKYKFVYKLAWDKH